MFSRLGEQSPPRARCATLPRPPAQPGSGPFSTFSGCVPVFIRLTSLSLNTAESVRTKAAWSVDTLVRSRTAAAPSGVHCVMDRRTREPQETPGQGRVSRSSRAGAGPSVGAPSPLPTNRTDRRGGPRHLGKACRGWWPSGPAHRCGELWLWPCSFPLSQGNSHPRGTVSSRFLAWQLKCPTMQTGPPSSPSPMSCGAAGPATPATLPG